MKKKPFEDAVNELENIVEQLEKGEVTLDEALTLFESGIKLSKTCQDILDKAEQKVNVLLKSEDEGIITRPFEQLEENQ